MFSTYDQSPAPSSQSTYSSSLLPSYLSDLPPKSKQQEYLYRFQAQIQSDSSKSLPINQLSLPGLNLNAVYFRKSFTIQKLRLFNSQVLEKGYQRLAIDLNLLSDDPRPLSTWTLCHPHKLSSSTNSSSISWSNETVAAIGPEVLLEYPDLTAHQIAQMFQEDHDVMADGSICVKDASYEFINFMESLNSWSDKPFLSPSLVILDLTLHGNGNITRANIPLPKNINTLSPNQIYTNWTFSSNGSSSQGSVNFHSEISWPTSVIMGSKSNLTFLLAMMDDSGSDVTYDASSMSTVFPPVSIISGPKSILGQKDIQDRFHAVANLLFQWNATYSGFTRNRITDKNMIQSLFQIMEELSISNAYRAPSLILTSANETSMDHIRLALDYGFNPLIAAVTPTHPLSVVPRIWGWMPNEPSNLLDFSNLNSMGSTSPQKDLDIQHVSTGKVNARCAIMDRKTNPGRWISTILCSDQRFYSACRKTKSPLNGYDNTTWMRSLEPGFDGKCPDGYSFSLPRSALENTLLYLALESLALANSTSQDFDGIFLPLNDYDRPGCWVHGNLEEPCPIPGPNDPGISESAIITMSVIGGLVVLLLISFYASYLWHRDRKWNASRLKNIQMKRLVEDADMPHTVPI